jgi:integrase/recombinase XerD
MSPLADAADAYLRMRRALGFRLHHLTWWLPSFVTFMEDHGSSTITTDLALRWARQPADASPGWWARRLSAVRQFAKHRHAYDPSTEIPGRDLIRVRRIRPHPYIYSDDEIATLIGEAPRFIHQSDLRVTYPAVLRLLVVTGMRVGEAHALDEHDVDWDASLLRVRRAKFGKDRLLPLHPSTMAALREYARFRDRQFPHRPSASFFVSSKGSRILHQNFHHVFLRVIRHTGIGRPGERRPTLHDLRHTFAIKTMREWYRTGVDVEQRLPVLSTYLGHVSPSSTYWYLTGTPDLLALASAHAEKALAGQS